MTATHVTTHTHHARRDAAPLSIGDVILLRAARSIAAEALRVGRGARA